MQYTTALRWVTIVGLFVAPFVLFISPAPGLQLFGNMFFPFITGKNFAFRILVELMFLAWAVLALKDPKYRPTSSWLMWSALLFVVWMALATAFSVDPIKSMWSNFERMEGYVGLLHLFAWFVVAGAVLSVERLWERFFDVSIFAAMLTGLLALFQVLHLFGMTPSSQSGARADTTFGNAAYLGVYMLIMLFITLYMLIARRYTAGAQIYYGLALVLEAVGLYATETRGAILGAIGGLIVAAAWVAWQGKNKEFTTLRRVSMGALVAIVVLAALFVGLRHTSVIQNSSTLSRIANISLSDRTTASRFQIWSMAWHGFTESPKTVIIGWGQESFNFVFNKYYEPSMWDQEQWFDRAHNQFVDWFINGGLVAGLLYLSLYALAAWAIIRTNKLSVPEQAVLLGLFAGFAFNNLFVFDNLVSAMYFWALLAFVHGMVRRSLPAHMWLTRPMGDHSWAIAAPVVAIVVGFGGWYFNAAGMARAQTLVNALGVVNTGNVQQANTLFASAAGPMSWPDTPIGKQEVAEQLAQYATQVASSGQSPDVQIQTLAIANQSLQDILAQRPHDARLELFDAMFYGATGDKQHEIDKLKAALADSPGKQQILFQLGITELNAGDPTSALADLKAAFDEAPAYPAARVLYASGYYYTGHMAQGDQILIDGFGTTTVDNDQLLSIYNDTKQYARGVAIWNLRISKDPKNTNLYLGLAQEYFVSGDTAKTIATLQEIAKIDPAQGAQVAQVISQIQSGALKPPAK